METTETTLNPPLLKVNPTFINLHPSGLVKYHSTRMLWAAVCPSALLEGYVILQECYAKRLCHSVVKGYQSFLQCS